MTAEEAETKGYCTRGETGDGVEVTYPDGSKKWMPIEFFKNHFTPTCPRATYNFQLRAMKDYLDILEVRAKIENINLN